MEWVALRINSALFLERAHVASGPGNAIDGARRGLRLSPYSLPQTHFLNHIRFHISRSSTCE